MIKETKLTFFLIFKFILIYLLHVLFVLKIKGIFEKRKSQPNKTNWKELFSLYIVYIYRYIEDHLRPPFRIHTFSIFPYDMR